MGLSPFLRRPAYLYRAAICANTDELLCGEDLANFQGYPTEGREAHVADCGHHDEAAQRRLVELYAGLESAQDTEGWCRWMGWTSL